MRQPTPNLLDADADVLGTVLGSSRKLQLSAIRLDGGTQPRAALNLSHITDLIADLDNGAMLPPIDVMYDGETYWLFDGYHRVHAVRQARGDDALIDARVHQGSQQDAQWASYAANKAHGLRRTTEDKQRAIVAALRHPNGASRSNREIARHLGVDDKTVGDWRNRLESAAEIPQVTERTGADGKTYNTANIGAKPAPKPATDTRRTYESGLPALNMPMQGAATAPQTPPGAEFTVSELIDLVHACVTRTGMPPALDGTPFWFQLNADVAAAGKGKRQWSIVNLRAAVNALRPTRTTPATLPATAPADDRPLPAWVADEPETEAPAPVLPAELRGWSFRYNGDGTLYLEHDDGRTTESESLEDVDELIAQAERMDEGLHPDPLTASDMRVMKPAPAADIAQENRKNMLLDTWRLNIQSMLDGMKSWGDLTGRYTATSEAERGLRKMLDITNRELSLMRGDDVPEANEEAWL